jgi:quercetin dioxygenase-like cupin family protein
MNRTVTEGGVAARAVPEATVSDPFPAFVDWDALPVRELYPGVLAQLVANERLMLARVVVPAGTVVPAHSHPHEQAGWVAHGSARFTIDGVTRDLVVGDHYLIPGGAPHGVIPGADGLVAIDVFSPPREDFLALPIRD